MALALGGASIVVNARGNRAEADAVAREIEALGVKALVHIGDVADAAAAQAMADMAVKHLGGIDILVNNAALRREKSFAEMSYAEWREILDVTLDGAFHCAKACLPALRKSGAGTIVNIGGLSAHTGAKNRAHVVTAKAGIVGFTRALAHDLAADGITVNCVVPGLIGTPRPKDKPEPAHHLTHRTIGRVRGSKLQTYTAGVVCAKVARYAERIHHPDRLLYPQRRTGPKGSGKFARISWDEALDEIADRFNEAEREFGAESVWPYYYAGTMGLVMRDGINRLAHVKKYSRFYQK